MEEAQLRQLATAIGAKEKSLALRRYLFGKVFYGGYSCVHCAWWATTLELYAKCRWCSNDGWWVTYR